MNKLINKIHSVLTEDERIAVSMVDGVITISEKTDPVEQIEVDEALSLKAYIKVFEPAAVLTDGDEGLEIEPKSHSAYKLMIILNTLFSKEYNFVVDGTKLVAKKIVAESVKEELTISELAESIMSRQEEMNVTIKNITIEDDNTLHIETNQSEKLGSELDCPELLIELHDDGIIIKTESK